MILIHQVNHPGQELEINYRTRQRHQNESINDIWEKIAECVLSQGFVVGTHANQLTTVTNLP